MIFWFKIKFTWSSNLFNLKVFCIKLTDWCIRMNHVWNLTCSFFESSFCFFCFCFYSCNFFLDCFTGSNKLLALVIIKLLLHSLSVFIALLLKSLKLCYKGSAFIKKFNYLVCICSHISVDDILFYCFKIVFNKFIV